MFEAKQFQLNACMYTVFPSVPTPCCLPPGISHIYIHCLTSSSMLHVANYSIHTRSKSWLCHFLASCLGLEVRVLLISLNGLCIWDGPYAKKQVCFCTWTWVRDSWNALENKHIYYWTERTPCKTAFNLSLGLSNRSDPLLLWIKRLDWVGGGLANGCSQYLPPVSCAHARPHYLWHHRWAQTGPCNSIHH